MRHAWLLICALCFGTDRAEAWSRPAHMVTAAIAYRELQDDPGVRSMLLDLLEAHPDRAPFEVAIDRATGEERGRRLFYECARWSDDARGTSYDHPTWHYAARPVASADAPTRLADTIEGNAIEAFALNLRVLGDRKASKAERAVALCWVMHLVGDIHQPLHTAQLFSKSYPEGDQLGSKQFVRESADAPAVTLHWYWDDSVHRSGTQDSVEERATELSAKFPRAMLLRPEKGGAVASFRRWAQDESYRLAASLAYGPTLTAGSSSETAPVVNRDYASAVRAAAESRVALAGYRLAAVLRQALSNARPIGE